MKKLSIYFAYPGELDTPTGGYHYDRRLIEELRQLKVEVLAFSLPQCTLNSDSNVLRAIEHKFSLIPDHSVVLVDGLAFGVLHELANQESRRLHLIALCHHPLSFETGLLESERAALFSSEQRALGHARAIIVTSQHTRHILIDKFFIEPKKITVAIPGTDQVIHAPCNGNPLRLLTVASLIKRKAHDILIKSLAALSDCDWQARFVGNEDLDSAWAIKLKEQVESLGLSSRIIFVGPVDYIQEEYHLADIFVLPSRFEGYGMVYAEALASGLPIIAAKAGAVPDVVPEIAGVLIPPDNVSALTEALHRIITDQPYRSKLQLGARQAGVLLPSWETTAKLVIDKLSALAIP